MSRNKIGQKMKNRIINVFHFSPGVTFSSSQNQHQSRKKAMLPKQTLKVWPEEECCSRKELQLQSGNGCMIMELKAQQKPKLLWYPKCVKNWEQVVKVKRRNRFKLIMNYLSGRKLQNFPNKYRFNQILIHYLQLKVKKILVFWPF